MEQEKYNQLLINIGHPKGRLLTNFPKREEKYGSLLKEAYEYALDERKMEGEIIICEDAYDCYRRRINSKAIVIKGNFDIDFSDFYRSVRKHASYKKALELSIGVNLK